MALVYREGDTANPISGTLEDRSGDPIDVSQAQVFVYLRSESGEMLIDGEEADVTDGENGEISYDLEDGDLDEDGDHDLFFRIKYKDGEEWVPTDGDKELYVEEVNTG